METCKSRLNFHGGGEPDIEALSGQITAFISMPSSSRYGYSTSVRPRLAEDATERAFGLASVWQSWFLRYLKCFGVMYWNR